MKGYLFSRCVVYLHDGENVAGAAGFRLGNYIRFGDGQVVEYLGSSDLTHVVVMGDENEEDVANVRKEIALAGEDSADSYEEVG